MFNIKIIKLKMEKIVINKLNSDLKIINVMFNISEKINQPYFVIINNLKDKDIVILKLKQINNKKNINKYKQQGGNY